jgi:hypothetical protein
MGRRGRKRTADRRAEKQYNITKISLAVAVAIGVISIAIALSSRLALDDPPPIKPSVEDQWLQTRAQIAEEGWVIKSSREAGLREDGRESTILTLGPDARTCRPNGPGSKPAPIPSNQVRIYDVNGGTLRESFRFQPSAQGCRAMDFKILGIGRYEDSRNDRVLIGDYSDENFELQGIHVPVVIKFNASSQRYTLHGLIRSNPGVPSLGQPLRGADRHWYAGAKTLFDRPYALTKEVKAWGASNVAFRPDRGGLEAPILVGLFRLSAGNAGDGEQIIETPVVYQPAIWTLFNDRRGQLLAGICDASLPGPSGPPDPASLLREIANRAERYIDGCDSSPF